MLYSVTKIKLEVKIKNWKIHINYKIKQFDKYKQWVYEEITLEFKKIIGHDLQWNV